MTAEVELRMPLGYVEMDAEEMEYLEGGSIACSRLAGLIDAGIFFVGLLCGGIGALTTQVGKHALKKRWKTIVNAACKVLGRVCAGIGGLGDACQGVLYLIDRQDSWLRWCSIGGVVAWGIDALESGNRARNGVVGA